jgi:hypothetical protein
MATIMLRPTCIRGGSPGFAGALRSMDNVKNSMRTTPLVTVISEMPSTNKDSDTLMLLRND